MDLMRRLLGVTAALCFLVMTACNGNNQTAATTATTVTTYTLTNGVCYVTGTSTVVASTYCGVSTTTTSTTTTSICTGYYYHPSQGWGVCNGTNCRNMYLYDQTGQLVWCP